MTTTWLILLERSPRNWSAWVPDLPGCVATGRTRAEALERMRVAIALHVQGLREDGLAVPKTTTRAAQVRVAA